MMKTKDWIQLFIGAVVGYIVSRMLSRIMAPKGEG